MDTTGTVTRTDRDLQADVLAELTRDRRVSPTEVGVTVAEAVVTLTGWVDSYPVKWAAERAAHRVAAVRAVANDLTVRIRPSAQLTDAEIAGAVAHALAWDAFVPVDRLEITVAAGWVTVRGAVEWEYQRRAAEQAVRGLAGVRGVSNGLTVRPATAPAER